MNFFIYKLIEDNGNVGQGILKLPYDTEPSVITYLERHGNTVIFVKRVSGVFSYLLNFFNLTSQKKVKRSEVAEILASLSVMLKSGIPVLDGLEEIVLESNNRVLVEALDGVIFHLESGSSVTEAVNNYPAIFTPMVVQLIRIGEETGALDRTIQDAADHLNRVETIIADTKQALIYPAFVMGSMALAMLFWFYFVVPTIIDLFKEMGIELPVVTEVILTVSTFIQQYALYILIFLAVLFLIIKSFAKQNIAFRKQLHKLMLKLPVINKIREASNLAFITEYFNLLLSTGIDMFRSLAIMQEAMTDEVYKEKLTQLSDSIRNGLSVTDSFRQVNFFPNFIIRMISVGEQTGTLSDQLHQISKEYRKRLTDTVNNIGKMMEPLVIILAGLIFAVIVAGLFLPIYDLIDALSV